MGNQSVFERVEKKYRMNRKQYEAFLNAAEGKIHADKYGLHTIRNIYYDTQDYELIRSSIEKPKYKEKFRLRGYGEIRENSPVFLEIKKKYNGVVYKRRTELPFGEAKAYLERGILPDNDNQIMREIDYFMKFHKPFPRVYLAYDRVAYQGDEEAELRITIDRNIRSRRHHLELSYDGECTLLSPGEYLMEIKVDTAYPLWLADLLCELQIYPVSFSKYGAVYAKALMAGEICLDMEERVKMQAEMRTEVQAETQSEISAKVQMEMQAV
ncbi:polyphosphate polymerase domain-containing protein [Roseburia hominis]